VGGLFLIIPFGEPDNLCMKLAVIHRTTFRYNNPVRDSENVLHLEPREFRTQRTLSALIRVLPPTRLKRFVDLFQNVTHRFELPAPHRKLEIESRIRVENVPSEVTAEARQLTFPEALEVWVGDDEIRPFLQDSRWVSRHPEIWRAAIDLIAGRPAIYDQACGIMNWIHENFQYQAGVTDVETHIEKAFELRRGVCQDYAHVMIGMCREVGLPARYVSGYLYNGPMDHLIGNQASHAWVEVNIPMVGWVGFDPTNNTLVDQRFVKVAVGRDYSDVAPIQGVYMGGGQCQLEVHVVVKKVGG